MKQLSRFLVVGFAVFVAFAWKEAPEKVSYAGKEYRCEYEVINGMHHGKYTSWYPNGKKKAEGSFLHNMRHGEWTVYDSTGRKRMVRNYKNNFEFELIFPKPSDEGPIPVLREPKWKPERDSTGRIPYFHLEERAVVVSKRVWRYLPENSDSPLFANSNFYHTLIDSLTKSTSKGFVGFVDDEFRSPISNEYRSQLADTAGRRIIGYRLKEDWFFDKDRMLSETRIVGICPVYKLPGIKADTFDMCWFYFPPLRSILMQQKVAGPGHPEHITSLDDLFFFRYFHAPVYKESNIYDRTLRENLDNQLGLTLTMERRRVEMSLMEIEHDVWISFSP